MAKMLLNRLVHMVLVFWMFITLLFFMLHLAPGDVTQRLVGNPNVPAEAQEALKRQLGLDRPLIEQYITYLANFVQGDLGVSFSRYPEPVMQIISERMPRTIMLFLAAVLLAYGIGFVLGKLLAWKRGGFFEYATTLTGVFLYTVFLPWFALMMIWVFAFALGWFPIRGFLTPVEWVGAPFEANDVFWRMIITLAVLTVVIAAIRAFTARMNDYQTARTATWTGWSIALVAFVMFWWSSPMWPYALDIAHHTALPIITLALVNFGGAMLLTRTSMLETLREDYILTAHAKGLPERVVRDRHAARNALLPVVTSLVLALAFVISGGVVTETVFSWEGIGLTLIEAVQQQDPPLAVGAFAFLGVLVLVGHLVIDIVYTLLDPRIRI